MGPTVMPDPPTTLSRLNEMFAASTHGMMSRLASPCSRELGKATRRTSSERAASPCISPSTSRSGRLAASISIAVRIFTAEGASLVPIEMREWYEDKKKGMRVDGRATYGRFRRFQVNVDEKLAPVVKP